MAKQDLLVAHFAFPFFCLYCCNKMPNTVKLYRTKVNVYSSLVANINLVRRLASNQRSVSIIPCHSSKPAGGNVRGGVRGVPFSHHSLEETVKWFPLQKSIIVVGRQLFGVFGCPEGWGHRKLSSTRSLQSRHISSKSVMSSKVSPSRFGNVELLEPVSMALSSDV